MAEEFRSNSFKSRETDPSQELKDDIQVKRVVTGEVVKLENKKRKILKAFIPEIGERTLGVYIVRELIIPGAKTMIGTVLHGIVSRVFGGGNGYSNRYYGGNIPFDGPYSQFTPYGSRFTGYEPKKTQTRTYAKGIDDLDCYVMSKEAAEEVLDILDENISRFGVVPVSGFYEAINITPAYTVNNYGWTSLVEAKIVPNGDGYSIKFPRPRVI